MQAIYIWCDITVEGQCRTKLYKELTEKNEELNITAEKAEQAAQAKTEFLSRMSHDIRTPMNAIIGLTHLAKSEDDLQTVKGYLHKIDSSSKFLLGLINDILDMSKIENGEMTLNEAPFSYGEFILIFNQPTDKSSAEISPFFVKLPCRAASPPAVTFLDWAYFICRLCL